jgi:hypothetical protein
MSILDDLDLSTPQIILYAAPHPEQKGKFRMTMSAYHPEFGVTTYVSHQSFNSELEAMASEECTKAQAAAQDIFKCVFGKPGKLKMHTAQKLRMH